MFNLIFSFTGEKCRFRDIYTTLAISEERLIYSPGYPQNYEMWVFRIMTHESSKLWNNSAKNCEMWIKYLIASKFKPQGTR